jgi:hypothetical protein
MTGNSLTVRKMITGMPNIRKSLETGAHSLAIVIWLSDGTIQLMPDIPTIEQGKKACDVYIHSSRINRAEMCDTQEGEIIYARGYRPQRWFDVLVEGA